MPAKEIMLRNVYEICGGELDAAVLRALPDWPWLDDDPQPSSDYTDGGPIIEHFKLFVHPVYENTIGAFSHWEGSVGLNNAPWAISAIYIKGPTFLIAAMRCLVVNMLGERVNL